MADLLIIDGDNVAHRLPAVGGDDRRELLLAALSTYIEQTGTDAIVVLDGHGVEFAVGRLQVRYAAAKTADSVIERLAHRHAGSGRVTVVSSDSVLRHVAQRDQVEVMSAGELVNRLSSNPPEHTKDGGSRQRFQLGDAVDPATRARLERIRRDLGRRA